MLFTHYGVPEEVLTDCGANFLSRLLKLLYNLMDLYNLMGIRGLKTTPYHPQTDGMFERFNQTMNVMPWQHGMASGTKLCRLSLASTEQHQMQQQDLLLQNCFWVGKFGLLSKCSRNSGQTRRPGHKMWFSMLRNSLPGLISSEKQLRRMNANKRRTLRPEVS